MNQTAPSNFTLPAWDGRTSSIGVSIDKNFTRFLWYIGNDSSLHQVGNTNYTWTVRANQSDAFWPQADEPNANLAVAYDFSSSMVRLYYLVKGQLSEVTFQNNTWKAWTTVPIAAPVPTVVPSATPSASDAASSSDTGLSTGAKAGIGVGVSLGAIAISAAIAILILARKRKQQEFEAPPSAAPEGSTTISPDTPAPSYGSPALASAAAAAQNEPYPYDQKSSPSPYADEPKPPQQLDGTVRSEMFVPRPLYELPSQGYSHELVAEAPPARH